MVTRSLLAMLLATLPLAGQAAPGVEQAFDDLYSAASSQAAGASIPAAVFQLARQRAAADPSPFANMGQLANYLADDYSLYARLHSEALRAHCQAQDVEIAPYLAALASGDDADARMADRIYARLGIAYENIWQQLKPQVLGGMAGLVDRFASELGEPASGLCARLASDPGGSARRLAYASVRASRSQVLRAIAP